MAETAEAQAELARLLRLNWRTAEAVRAGSWRESQRALQLSPPARPTAWTRFVRPAAHWQQLVETAEAELEEATEAELVKLARLNWQKLLRLRLNWQSC